MRRQRRVAYPCERGNSNGNLQTQRYEGIEAQVRVARDLNLATGTCASAAFHLCLSLRCGFQPSEQGTRPQISPKIRA